MSWRHLDLLVAAAAGLLAGLLLVQLAAGTGLPGVPPPPTLRRPPATTQTTGEPA